MIICGIPRAFQSPVSQVQASKCYVFCTLGRCTDLFHSNQSLVAVVCCCWVWSCKCLFTHTILAGPGPWPDLGRWVVLLDNITEDRRWQMPYCPVLLVRPVRPMRPMRLAHPGCLGSSCTCIHPMSKSGGAALEVPNLLGYSP